MAASGDGERTVLGHRPSRFLRTLVVAVVLGAFGGLVTVAFVWLLEKIQHVLWTWLPDTLDVDQNTWYFVIPMVLVGAVLLGLARRRLGEYPVNIEQAMEDHARDGEFDHRHIAQATLISLISLGFGAALGPEAALMAILGGISSWVARVIDANTTEEADLSFVGISGAFGALFGVAGSAALTLDPRGDDVADARSGRLLRVIPGLLAALAGLYIYRHLGTADHYFDLGLPSYSFSWSDLAWSVPVTVVGAAVGLAFLGFCRVTDLLLAPLAGRAVLESVVGGLGLALLACWSALVLFSGHQGVDTLIREYGDDSVRFLVLIAVAKLVAASLLLSAKWKGGRFFPLMFVGAAVGLAMSEMTTSIGEVPAIAAGMTVIVGVLIGRPLVAAVFMIFFFPVAAWPVVLVAAVVGGVVGGRLGKRIEGRTEAPPAVT